MWAFNQLEKDSKSYNYVWSLLCEGVFVSLYRVAGISGDRSAELRNDIFQMDTQNATSMNCAIESGAKHPKKQP